MYFEPQIRKILPIVVSAVERQIILPDIEVIVEDKPEATIPETGMGGFAPDANRLFIRIDPEKESLRKNFEREFRSTLTHELHHCARWASVGYGTTLLEAMVSEGLADHFDIEVNGGDPKPWSVSVEGEELQELREKAEPFLNSEYDEAEWFFGAGELPKWTGYSLGFAIVGDYIEHAGKSASELVNVKASELVK